MSRRWWLRAAQALVALASLIVVAGTGYGWVQYRSFTAGLTRVDAIPGPPSGRAGTSAKASPGTDVDGQAQNILLVGDDHRPANASPQELALLSTGQDGGSTNTDTMMVLHLPAGKGTPTVISFPRDSWVDIPGHGKGKLNSAFADGAADGGGDAGGMRLLIGSIQDLTGLTIDHFVRISLIGFYDIAKVLGPIQVCLKEPADDPYSGLHLPAGVSTLDAQQALSFVRQRHGVYRGDLGREVRQQYFLATELRKVSADGLLFNPSRTRQLLSAVSSALQTDPDLDLLQLATRFRSLSPSSVHFTTIPVAGTPTITTADGTRVSIVELDMAALPAYIDRVIGAARPTSSTGHPAAGTPPASNQSPAAGPTAAPTDLTEPPRAFSAMSCVN